MAGRSRRDRPRIARGVSCDSTVRSGGRVGPADFLATIYRRLGIDYKHASIPNFAGRPVKIVEDGDAIPELARA